MELLKHPALGSRSDELVALFGRFSEEAEKGQYIDFTDWTKYVVKAAEYYYGENPDGANRYKGDMLEVFCEIYFKLIKSKNSSGVLNYEPLHAEDIDDMGVDGIGINYQNNPCVVQIKFRSDPTSEIDYSALANTWTQAYIQKMISETYDKQSRSLILFTNCAGANDNAVKMFASLNRLFVINNEIIKSEVNGNIIFWREAFKLIIDTINS